MDNRSGQYKNNLSGKLTYKSFSPKSLPPNPELELDANAVKLLVKANRLISKLDGISSKLPNIDLFVSMYVRKEALLSSQIEGTQATLDDILDPNIEENTNQNVSEVINYIKATNFATNRLTSLPLCNRLLLETHAVLMTGMRGEDKNIGAFRKSQNWIGPAGSTLRNAKYIPPNLIDMIEAMSDLEKFINKDDDIDKLIKIALIHYQFETIHPFLDGNGRIGRLMINLYLKEQNILQYPTFYISYYLKRNRIEYYDRLSEVREKGNYEQWVKFFLEGIVDSAQDAIETIDLIVELHNKNYQKITSVIKPSKTIFKIFNYIEKNPIINIKKTSIALGVAFNTVSKAVEELVLLNILKQPTTSKRNRSFFYEEYLQILRKDT